MNSSKYLKRIEMLSRKYAHRPRYMAWRIFWTSFLALFTKEQPHIPPAEGIYRNIQLAAFKILQEINRICRQNGLTYWIDFGTVLGAVRHGGFIPWDDDIDLSMPRADYERFADLFNQQTQDPNLRVELSLNPHRASVILKVKHQLLPHVFVDIFPVDFCATRMNNKQKLAFTHQIKKMAHRPSFRADKAPSAQALHNQCLIQRQDLPKTQELPGPTVFYGIDFFHTTHPYNAFDYETIFPLKTISFEGHTFPCVSNVETYLTQIYGKYKQMPKKLQIHTSCLELPAEEKQFLRHYVNSSR